MERFLEPPAPRHLQRYAIYEIAVAHLNISLSGKRYRIKINESKTGNGTVTVDLGIRRELSGKDLRRWSSETLAPIAGVLNLLEAHLADFINACNYARRLKTLKGLTPYEYICKCWTAQPERFKFNPLQQMPGLNNLDRMKCFRFDTPSTSFKFERPQRPSADYFVIIVLKVTAH